jgi:hypothetical protein
MRYRRQHADRRTSIPLSFALVLVLLLAAGCASGASGAASGEQRTPSPEESMTSDLPTSPAPVGLECGAPFDPTTGGVLTVTGHFPAAVSADEQIVTGTVAVVAKGSEARGVVTPQAEAFLVRDGRIVTLPMPQDSVGRRLDLAGRRVERMPAMATLVPCSGGGVLATGTYDLYVRVVLNHDDGSRADSLGGPWPLEVR